MGEIKANSNRSHQTAWLIGIIIIVLITGCGYKQINFSEYCIGQCEGNGIAYKSGDYIICKCIESGKVVTENEVVMNCSIPKLRLY